jgi:hypothetical protein
MATKEISEISVWLILKSGEAISELESYTELKSWDANSGH